MSKLILGDCRKKMKGIEDNAIDTIITDPPYGLKFMGKKWDYDIPAVEVFEEMLRVAKPGAFLLCFGGTRTFHRIACNIEDAGWMIRDTIMWLYGSGFPKSSNISKNIDKRMGVEREVVGQREDILKKQGADIKRGYRKIVDSYKAGAPERDCGFKTVSADITAPATDEAKLWDGWGTALKPAFEPIIVAMKPTEGTFVDNALNWGVAGLNIDRSRIGVNEKDDYGRSAANSDGVKKAHGSFGGKAFKISDRTGSRAEYKSPKGRWPANIILDEEAGRLLDEQSGQLSQCGGRKNTTHRDGMFGIGQPGKIYKEEYRGASRFFYTAKASKAERNAGCEGLEEKAKTDKYAGRDTRCKVCGKFFLSSTDACTCNPEKHGSKSERAMNPKSSNNHPTVKPLKLMEYLCRLTRTPMGGIVLDPYVGSGTTVVACINTGRKFIAIEMDERSYKIAVVRAKHAHAARHKKS